ncbi:hypothetical protein EMCRGX_G009091 [Ephydatia muelleri]
MSVTGETVECDASSSKYSYSTFFEYVTNALYPSDVSKEYKRGLRKRAAFFSVEAGHLYYVGGKNKQRPRMVIEKEEDQLKIVKTVHEEGHVGRDKTLAQISDRYYWPELYNQVCSYISSCERCQRINPKLKKGHAPLHPIPVKDEVWHQIGIDFIGPLAITPRGNKYIMTVTDYYSKWAEATPLQDKSAPSVAQFLYSCSPWMLGMTKHHKRFLEQGGLLDDLVIYAALMLLRDQFPTMSGFQPTVLCQVKGFKPMNTDDSLHWRGALGYNSLISDGSVFLYDSLVGNTETLPLSLKEQFSTVYKCAANDSALIVTQYPVQQQSGSTDCGLFSIAFAYHAAIGDNLRTLIFDQGRMRSHLLSCFERSEITPFPLATTTTDTIRRRVPSSLAASCSQTNGKFRQRQQENNERKVKNSVALAREGLLGKACQALTSAGIAPKNNLTWELIQSKHPKGPPPIPPAPSSPSIPILSKDFNIAMVLRSFPKSTACGPSGLLIQHLLDTAEVPLQFPISSSLRDIVNLLASGKIPVSVSRHLAGGSLTALVKGKPGFPPDIRPIAVGEALRSLTGIALKNTGKNAVLKIDMCNAFNLVSHQALLDECAFHFPDLLPWASWCYGQQPLLQHPFGTLTSEVGVQQGDPLGPMFFNLVLHKLVSAIATDEDTAKLLFHAWYLDDGVDTSDDAWEQAQLSLSRAPQQHLLQSIDDFNHCIPPSKAISFVSLTNTPSSQKALSGELEDELFRQLLSKSSVPDRARLLSVSSPHASAWLSVVPSPGLNLHLEPAEFQAAIQWWLGIGVAHGSMCPHCPHSLDPLGHHALTCKHGGDVVNRLNRLRDVFAESCRRACIGVQVEAGSGLGRDEHHTQPADVLANNWMLGKPAAFDFAVTSPLNSSTLHEASVTAGSAPHATEARKHQAKDVKCAELGWVSIPVVVETYGCSLSQRASRLAMRLNSPKSTTTASLYGRLRITLV